MNSCEEEQSRSEGSKRGWTIKTIIARQGKTLRNELQRRKF
jgi:hypothetical protein